MHQIYYNMICNDINMRKGPVTGSLILSSIAGIRYSVTLSEVMSLNTTSSLSSR
jgi:hypothetical protein